jgi:hypothetical protein
MTSREEAAQRARQLFSQLQAVQAVRRTQTTPPSGKDSARHSEMKACSKKCENAGQKLKRLRRRLRQAVKRRLPG